MLFESNGVLLSSKRVIFYLDEHIKISDLASMYFIKYFEALRSKDWESAEYLRQVYLEPTEARAVKVLELFLEYSKTGEKRRIKNKVLDKEGRRGNNKNVRFGLSKPA